MIIDRISLNIIYNNLYQIQQNEGMVSNINVTVRFYSRISSTSTVIENLEVLRTFIDKYAPISTFVDEDCSVMGLYKLNKFSIYKNGTNNNLVYFDTDKFITKSTNINKISVDDLNLKYFSQLEEIKSVFGDIALDEYILNQEEYIDCGYIEIHFQEAMDKLKILYDKYK